MQVTSVKRYPEPDFPTYAILYDHPELLRLVPKRWRSNPLVLAALAGVCTILWGCHSVSLADEAKGGSGKVKTHPVSLVSPIFPHGNGWGSYGCVAIEGPVFLSEEEARQVVSQEARKAGVSFVGDINTLPPVDIPETDRWEPIADDRENKPSGAAGAPGFPTIRKLHSGPLPLTLDGTDKRRSISYEYVSKSDFDLWEKKYPPDPTTTGYDLRSAANALRRGLAEAKPTGTYAVFYDPVVFTDLLGLLPGKGMGAGRPTKDDYTTASTQAIEKAREELRKQVRDFIAWLKAQGVI